MIALITSTLRPTSIYSVFSEQERYDQTIITIKKLAKNRFDEMYLIDNSIPNIDQDKIVTDSETAVKVFNTLQYSFENKGLNEALLILNNLQHLPAETSIFKMSARYVPTDNFSLDVAAKLDKYDFIGVGENFGARISAFSTRAYFVKNKAILEKMLITAVEEMISYHKGVYGIGSALNFIQSIFKTKLGSPFQLSIEQAFARIMKEKKNYLLIDRINIEGTLAGFNTNNTINE